MGKKKCCVPGCTSDKDVPNHNFPIDSIRRATWIESVKLHHLKDYNSSQMQDFRVCYKHFESKDYNPTLHRRLLMNTAVPVLSEVFNVNDLAISGAQNMIQQQPQQTENDILENISHNDIPLECNNNNYNNQEGRLQLQAQVLQSQCREISAVNNLSPECKKLYEENKKLKRKIRYLKGVTSDMKQRLKETGISTANSYTSNDTVIQNFIEMVIKNKDLHPQVTLYNFYIHSFFVLRYHILLCLFCYIYRMFQ